VCLLHVCHAKQSVVSLTWTAWLQLRRATALWNGNTFQHCFQAWKEFVHGQKEKTARTSKVQVPALQLSFQLQDAVLCCSMPCYAVLCYAMLRYAIGKCNMPDVVARPALLDSFA